MFFFTETERMYFNEMRGITKNENCQEVLVGLSLDETIFYMTYSRDLQSGKSDEDKEKYLYLNDKHESARLSVLSAENQLRVNKPTLN